MGLAERITERLDANGISRAELARRSNVPVQTLYSLISRDSRSSPHLLRIARELQTTPEYLVGEVDDPDEGYAPPATDKRIIEVPMIDLAYGMGGTYLDGDDPDVRTEPFPLEFIRRYTPASADVIVFAEGAGDSMMPTIHSTDLLLIDRSEISLRLADQVWACSFGGVGMIKRLRPMPDGSVAIISDNPNVPDASAVDGELHLIGRVVAKVSKL